MKNLTVFALVLLVTMAGLGPAAVTADTDIDAQEAVLKEAVDKVAPSVVQIQTSGGKERVGRMIVNTGATTGLVVSADGYILSSAFNFVQQPSSIVVVLSDGTKKAARLVARDLSRMLVMLKIDVDQPLPTPTPIPHDEMRVGQWTVAVGRVFEPEAPNVSIGILSATNRVWSKAVQTDAKISPSNYGGPLIDVQGRVFGILVPLSPQQQTEVAGAEWYDSGIGFAIPLIDLEQPIEQLKQGQDLHRGILGVTLKGANMFADPAVVATAVRNSPAAKAGIKPKDRIIEIDGQPVSRQTHLKHALGPCYAGQIVHLVALRGGKRVEFDVELAAQVDPYERPYVGILPSLDSTESEATENKATENEATENEATENEATESEATENEATENKATENKATENKATENEATDLIADGEKGVGVRYVLPESPAAKANLQVGDRIVSLAGETVENGEVLRELLANREPGQTVALGLLRAGEEIAVELELGREPETVPSELPPRREQPVTDAAPEVVSLKLAAEANQCFALIPAGYDASRPHGVVIWLSAPSPFDKDDFVKRWARLGQQHELIVLAPQPNDEQRWVVTEAPIIAKLFQQLARDYVIDAHRVVAHGYQGGASLAYRFAFENRDIVHGVAAVDAAVPLGVRPTGNDSIEHLAFWLHAGEQSRRAERVRRDVEQFRELKFPVTAHLFAGEARYLDEEELSELARWVDIQDRI